MSSTLLQMERGAPASMLPRGTARGTACSHRNHTMAGGHLSHLDHDDDSTVDACTAAEHRAPSRVMTRFSEGQRVGARTQQANTEREAVQHRSKLTGKQAVTTA
jgi:hypothetical protein